MAFELLDRPNGLRWLLAPRLPQNTKGFQGAHIIGDNFWTRPTSGISWLNSLSFEANENTLNNGVLLPESERGGVVLGAATHLGNHFALFDDLFYYPLDQTDPVSQQEFLESDLFLNVLERNRTQLRGQAAIEFADDPDGLAFEIAQIDLDFRIQVRNFLDFAKLLFLHDEILDNLGFGDQDSLVLNTTDPRFVGTDEVNFRFAELVELNNGKGIFDYDAVVGNALFQYIAGLREELNDPDATMDGYIVQNIPEAARILYPDGQIMWNLDVRSDILARDLLVTAYSDWVGNVLRVDYEPDLGDILVSDAYGELVGEIKRGLEALSAGHVSASTSFYTFLDRLQAADPLLFSGVFDNIYDALRDTEIWGLPPIPPELTDTFDSAQEFHEQFSVGDSGHVEGAPAGLPVSLVDRLAETGAALLYAQLKTADAAHRLGWDSSEFQAWTRDAAQTDDLAVEEAGSFAVTTSDFGNGSVASIESDGAFSLDAVLDWLEGIQSDYPDGHPIHELADLVEQLAERRDKISYLINLLPNYLQNFLAGVIETALDAVLKTVLDKATVASGRAAVLQESDSELVVGFDAAALVGADETSFLIHAGHGLALGGDGSDVLIGLFPDYVSTPGQNGGAPEEQRLVLDGGDDADIVMVIGGEGAIAIGGDDQDLIYNSSYKGQLWGDGLDGRGASDTGDNNDDTFWWSAGSFIMDAGKNDRLQMFGIPLIGGTNLSWLGTTLEKGTARDFLIPWVTYGLTDSGQLLVDGAIWTNLHSDQSEEEILEIAQVVENWDPGDLGIEFSIFGSGDEMSLLRALFSYVGDFAQAVGRFAKNLLWLPSDDPLVLDLNGDGLVSKGLGAVYFDNDGDAFGEKSGWLDGDDGFLVHDADGSGTIDATELFGGPGLAGFAELAGWDTTGDSIVNADDLNFADLQIWRDANENGITDAGELHSLAAFGITAFSVNAQPVDIETANGTVIRAESFYARADGSTGALGELVFEIDRSPRARHSTNDDCIVWKEAA